MNITYYDNQTDADLGSNAITDPSNYTGTDGQTIYVRIVDLVTDSCYDTSSFTLSINLPTIDAVGDLLECDTLPNDGFAEFDLESQTLGILGTQSSSDFIVTYYLSATDAASGTGFLTSPHVNVSSPVEPIYVRVESATDPTCYSVSSGALFNLEVVPADDAGFTVSPTCDGGTSTITGDTGGTFALNPVPTDGAVIDPVTGTVTNAQPGVTYTVEYTTSGACPTTESHDVTVYPQEDSGFTVSPTCDGGTSTITGDTGGTFAFNPVPTDGAVIDTATGTVTGGQPGVTYTVEYTTSGPCPEVEAHDVTVYAQEYAGFTVSPTCDGGTSTITGDTGGTFALNPVPTDGAVIDTTTGTVTGGQPGVTYTVEYTTSGPCPEVESHDVTVYAQEYAGFTVSPTCDGGTSTVTGDTGGAFAFNPVPTDGAVIDPVTGTVTNAQPGVTYTVEYTTTGNCPATETRDLAVLPLDDSSFTMAPTCDGGVATVTGQAGGTFAFAVAPTDGAVIDPVTGTVSGGGFATDYTVEYTTTGCVSTTQVAFTSHPEPVVASPTPLEVCDDNVPDGVTAFDLDMKNNEISMGNPALWITYYETPAGAVSGTGAVSLPYTNTSNPQTVYVRAEDINTGCYTTTSLVLQVAQAPAANVPQPLEFCDPDNDGFGSFDLTDADGGVTGGAAGLTVSYHETLSDAENGVLPLASPYSNIVAYQQTVWVRVESATVATDCATIVELVLIVHDTPDITDPPTPLEVCDDDTDGFALFDLTASEPELLNGLDPLQYTVSYHLDQAGADSGTGAIVGPGAYTNTTPNQQTLWVRVYDTATGCYSVTTLELVVNALPVLSQPPALSLCDYDSPGDGVEAFTLEDSAGSILNGQTGITLTFHSTQTGADTGTDQIFSPYLNTSNAQTVYVRAENDVTGCVDTVTLDLRVEPLPSPVTPAPLEVCDDDNDGFAQFDLESRTQEVLNGEPDVVVTYHETQDDAENGQNALSSPYSNIVEDAQVVYVRAENGTTGCYSLVELQLTVLPSPEVPLSIDDYVVCDDNGDGIAPFDLTVMDATVLGAQSPSDFILTYHVTQGDADTGNNPIVNVGSYVNTGNPQTLYVRLESVANGCVATGTFDLVVALPPVPVLPSQLDVCDDGYYGDWDGIAVFDLTQKDGEITGGDPTWTVDYYVTLADAQSGQNVIDPADAYTNTVNPQTLFVRVTDGDTGCHAFTTLTIRVNPNPTPQDPDAIELCDDVNAGDGVEVFDLTLHEADIINNEGGVTASYYETLSGAESGTGAIADPTAYTNTASPQVVYVRVTNDVTGCYTVVEQELVVHPLPDAVAVTDLVACEFGTDGVYAFDLESKTGEVLGGQDPGQFVVTYHESQADADAGTGALVSPYTNTSNPQTVYVAVTDTLTGCSNTTASFGIEVQEGAVATPPALDYVICDNLGDNDGLGQFNLTGTPNGDGYDYGGDLYGEILSQVTPGYTYTVSFYDSAAAAEAGVDPIPNVYENTSNPQVVYVRVDNDSTICYATTTLTLSVDLRPVFALEDRYVLCVDTNGTETVQTPPVIDTGLSASDYTFEWTDSSGAVVGTDAFLVPAVADTYGVLVTDNVTGCQSAATALVEQSSPPVVSAYVGTLAFADQHVIEVTATGDGQYEFSLDGGDWVSDGSGDGYTFSDVSAGEHTVTARDVNGCGQGSATVMVVDYPPFFTPNGDGYNDTWNIIGISSQVGAKIYIFDRYGKLLKQLAPNGQGWDGTFNGHPMPSDDYWFTVDYVEPADGTAKQFRAHFTLKK